MKLILDPHCTACSILLSVRLLMKMAVCQIGVDTYMDCHRHRLIPAYSCRGLLHNKQNREFGPDQTIYLWKLNPRGEPTLQGILILLRIEAFCGCSFHFSSFRSGRSKTLFAHGPVVIVIHVARRIRITP